MRHAPEAQDSSKCDTRRASFIVLGEGAPRTSYLRSKLVFHGARLVLPAAVDANLSQLWPHYALDGISGMGGASAATSLNPA